MLTTEQVAAKLGVQIYALYEDRRAGVGIPVQILGQKTYRYRKEDVLDYIAKHQNFREAVR
jgi:predicted site-specific integrase-resolvase